MSGRVAAVLKRVWLIFVSPPVQEYGGRTVVPQDVRDYFESLGAVSTMQAFRVAYLMHYGYLQPGTIPRELLLSDHARQRVYQDVLEHVRSRRTWFPDYVLRACYKPS